MGSRDFWDDDRCRSAEAADLYEPRMDKLRAANRALKDQLDALRLRLDDALDAEARAYERGRAGAGSERTEEPKKGGE